MHPLSSTSPDHVEFPGVIIRLIGKEVGEFGNQLKEAFRGKYLDNTLTIITTTRTWKRLNKVQLQNLNIYNMTIFGCL